MRKMKFWVHLSLGLLTMSVISCKDDDDVPDVAKENTPEIITNIKLQFNPPNGSGLSKVEVEAEDPDGAGPKPLQAKDSIRLKGGATYTLDIILTNSLAEGEEQDISGEIAEENDEHMFFFAWTDGMFSNPEGDGNIDARSDAVNYDSSENDENGLPVGLKGTVWTPANNTKKGSFRIKLQHQPKLPDGSPQKTKTSDSASGSTDMDFSFGLAVQEQG